MKKVIVLQHVSFEWLGTLNPLLKKAGFRIKYVNFARNPNSQPNLRRYDVLIILGGPMNVDEVDKYPHLITELALIREAIHIGIPVLGICLGAQLIAKALGGEVTKNLQKEIGWYDVSPTNEGKDDPLFALLGKEAKIFQWHSDTFSLPPEAVLLASTTTCHNQAFRYKDNVYGLQFHLEADADSIARWLSVPIHVAELATVQNYINPDQIRQDTNQYLATALELSNNFFTRFIKLFRPKDKYQIFRSR